MELPLIQLDPLLQKFADSSALSLSRNYHNWPERSLTWGSPVTRLIQLYVHDENVPTFNLWLCASLDRRGRRFWKRAFLFENQRLDEFRNDLVSLLGKSKEILDTWGEENLDSTTDLPSGWTVSR